MTLRQMIFTVVIASVVSVVAVQMMGPSASSVEQDGLQPVHERVLKTGVLRCGYGVVDPGIVPDPETGELKGFWVDIMNAIAGVAQLKVEWTMQVGWGESTAALKAGKIDAMCVWISPVEAKFVRYTTPIIYSPVHVYVRANDARFDLNPMAALNDPSITMVGLEGDTTSSLVEFLFPRAEKMFLSPLEQNNLTLAVLTKKADAFIENPAAIQRYEEENGDVFKRVELPLPLQTYGIALAVPQHEEELQQLLNVALHDAAHGGMVRQLMHQPLQQFPNAYLLPRVQYEK